MMDKMKYVFCPGMALNPSSQGGEAGGSTLVYIARIAWQEALKKQKKERNTTKKGKRSLNTWLLCGPNGHLNLNSTKWVQSTGIQGSRIWIQPGN